MSESRDVQVFLENMLTSAKNITTFEHELIFR